MAKNAKLGKPFTFERGPLRKKLKFSISIMFQLRFEVGNVISNYKMFFSTQNNIFNYLPK
jgi:hypothetical protein